MDQRVCDPNEYHPRANVNTERLEHNSPLKVRKNLNEVGPRTLTYYVDENIRHCSDELCKYAPMR